MSQNPITAYDSLVNTIDQTQDVDDLYLQCSKLTPQSKAILIGKLMQSNTPQIILNFGANTINLPVILQIQSFDKDQIAELIDNIAQNLNN